jgi:hypothetical protein
MHTTAGLAVASMGGLAAMLVVAAPAASEKPSAAQPFQTEISVHVDGDEPDGTSCVALVVPLGRQMLVEHVEVNVDVQDDPTQDNPDRVLLRKDVSITTTHDGAQAIHPVPLVEVGRFEHWPSDPEGNPALGDRWLASEETHIYATGPFDVCLTSAFSDASGVTGERSLPAFAEVTLSGQLSGAQVLPRPPITTPATTP